MAVTVISSELSNKILNNYNKPKKPERGKQKKKPFHFVNPQKEHPDHLQPQPKVSYPGSRMCAVVTEASNECQIWMKQPKQYIES